MATFVSRTPGIINTTLTTVDTEYSFTLPQDTKKFTIQCRTDDVLQFSFNVGGSNSSYMTIPEGASHSEDNLNVSHPGLTIYIRCTSSSDVVVECLYWRTT